MQSRGHSLGADRALVQRLLPGELHLLAMPGTHRKILVAILIAVNAGIGCAYLSPVRNRPVWDLPQFYFAAKLVRDGRVASLYDPSAYVPLVAELRQTDDRATSHSIYFNRPAFQALFLLPLAWLSFRGVTLGAVIANLLLVGVLVWKLPRWFGAPDNTRLWLFIFMPFLYSVAFGQDTLLLTLLVASGFYLTGRRQEVPAGILLGMALFKPHLIWAIPIALAAGRRWKALSAFIATGGTLALLSFALVGSRGIRQWIDLLRAPSTDTVPLLMGNARALGLYFGAPAAIAAAAVAMACFFVILRRDRFVDQFAAALLVGLLLSPHTYTQDYSLMAIVALASARPFARYLILLPWPYFYPPNNILPFALLALAYLIALVVISPGEIPAACIRLFTRSRAVANSCLHVTAQEPR